jgi:hypothetical protein
VSDINFKNASSLTLGLDFINLLSPIQFIWKPETVIDITTDRETGEITETERIVNFSRTHMGLSAQSVKTALETLGKTASDYGIWCLNDPEDPNSKQMVRYHELTGCLVKSIQEIDTKFNKMINLIIDIDGSISYCSNSTLITTRESTGTYKINYDGLFDRIPVINISIVNPSTDLCLSQISSINDTQCIIYVYKFTDGTAKNPQKIMVQLQ